ncbi:aminoglycoside phosphotransferase family protein [Sulfitobacter sp. SK012]|uniref:aminoglycoside phosphotransferase family protein n=1 Tax=Sulfitobacter sp. SK012 TaxID=1389005 RepID=UPI0013B389AB|nr:aminoglycoside phosphotransferase family protein [Sulfitobacter sp. SK012]
MPIRATEISNPTVKANPNTVMRFKDANGCVAYSRRLTGPGAAERIKKEVHALTLAQARLTGHQDLNSPRLIDFSVQQGYVLASEVQGLSILSNQEPLSHIEREEFVRNTGRCLGLLHDISGGEVAPFNMSTRITFLKNTTKETPFKDEYSRIVGLLEQLHNQVRGSTARFGFVHGDVNVGNILIDESSVGIIDFEFAHQGWQMGDVASYLLRLELVQSSTGNGSKDAGILSNDDRLAFAAGYGLDPAEQPEFGIMLLFEVTKMLLNAPTSLTKANRGRQKRLKQTADAVLEKRTTDLSQIIFGTQ